MRIAALGLVLALSACGKPAPEAPAPTPTPSRGPVVAPPVIQGGWATVFGDAKASIALFGNLGLRPGAYKPVGGRYVSKAQPTPMSDPSEKAINVADFVATGDATRLDSLRFSLDLVGADEKFAKAQFAAWVKQALHQFGAPGADEALPAIAAETPRTGTVTGATYAVARTTIPGGRRLAVTFTRPAGNPGPNQPRK